MLYPLVTLIKQRINNKNKIKKLYKTQNNSYDKYYYDTYNISFNIMND